MKEEKLASEALSWIGTPFVSGAHSKGKACDCIGFVKGVVQNCTPCNKTYTLLEQISLIRSRANEDFEKTAEALGSAFVLRPRICDVDLGDILIFDFKSTKHLGIVTQISDDGKVLFTHAYISARKVVENSLDCYFLQKMIGVVKTLQLL